MFRVRGDVDVGRGVAEIRVILVEGPRDSPGVRGRHLGSSQRVTGL